MEHTPHLYDTLFGLFGQLRHVWKDIRHLKTFIWMLVGLICEEKVHLPAWSPYVISRAQQAQSTVRRFRRWLNNHRIDVNAIWTAYIRHTLANWQGTLYLVLDTTSLWGRFCWIRVSLVYRGRAIPIAWRIIAHKSTNVAFSLSKQVLLQAAKAIPKGVKVVLLADRGFADVKLMRFLKEQLHWHWRIRIKKSFWFYTSSGHWRKVSRIVPGKGQAIIYTNAYITCQRFGPVCLGIGRPLTCKSLWYVVSDEPLGMEMFYEYGLRTDIEESVLDDKSNGFKIEGSRIDEAKALNRLVMVLAGVTLYLVSQGVKVVREKKRRWVDPHWYRGLSYLKIGWRYVKRALACGWRLMDRFFLPPGEDPEPAIASKRQAHKLKQRRFVKLLMVFT